MFTLAHHIHFGTRAGLPLFRDDEDRRDLLARVAGPLAGRLRGLVLAYCLMETHAHLVVECPGDVARYRLEEALAGYARAFNGRHAGDGGVLVRDAVTVQPVMKEVDELATKIWYVHANPRRTAVALVDHAHEWPWSGAREYAGLSLAPFAAVERGLKLLGDRAHRAVGRPAVLAGADPVATPCARPEVLLAAVAQACSLAPADIAGPARAEELVRARALFLRLGRLESYTTKQLVPYLGRSEARGCRILAGTATPERHLRVARTLVRDAGLRRRLPLRHP